MKFCSLLKTSQLLLKQYEAVEYGIMDFNQTVDILSVLILSIDVAGYSSFLD